MQLILELLKKIFVALSGIYTKAESDAALATKADATALTEEATAREEADATHKREIDAVRAYANSIAGGSILMYVDIPPDDGSTEYWATDPVDFHRYYRITIQKLTTKTDGTARIDWGDGIVDIKAYNAEYVTHDYIEPGRFYIVISGDVTTATSSGYTTAPSEFSASYAAGIGLVSATLEKITSVTAAFYNFKGEFGVKCTLPRCSNYVAAFTDVNAPTVEISLFNTPSCVLACRNVVTNKLIVRGVGKSTYIPYSPKIIDLTIDISVEDLSDYFIPTTAYNLKRVALFAPNLKRLSGFALTYHPFKNKKALTIFAAGLPSLENGEDLFLNTNLDKPSVLRILNALPDRTGVSPEQDGDGVITFTSSVATAAINNIDAELQAAIDAARNKNWTVEV